MGIDTFVMMIVPAAAGIAMFMMMLMIMSTSASIIVLVFPYCQKNFSHIYVLQKQL